MNGNTANSAKLIDSTPDRAESEPYPDRTAIDELSTRNLPGENRILPRAEWPTMSNAAYHGLAGEIVRAIEPKTESDPVAILGQFLAWFGSAVGRGPYYLVEADRHFSILNLLLVGDTSKSRKGTSASRVREIFEGADAEWVSNCIATGLSTGEGLIHRIRDPLLHEGTVVDPGIEDKRLLVLETEFVGVLAVMRRHGNNLSRVLRDLWDAKTVHTLTRKAPLHATDPHVSIVGHITAEELRKSLDRVSMANGFANRFVFLLVRRNKALPHGGEIDDKVLKELATRPRQAIGVARKLSRVRMAPDAHEAWEQVYGALSEGRPGMLGAILGRAEAQTIRLALFYALLDGEDRIRADHLTAALAVWRYCEESVLYIFGAAFGDSTDERILLELKRAGAAGLTRTNIRDLFGRHVRAFEIEAALRQLVAAGKAQQKTGPSTGGRRCEVWAAT
jgi:hypothetical protein